MKSIIILFYQDFLGIKSWYRENTLSRISVSILFLFTFLVISSFIFLFCGIFFRSLSSSQIYGLLTAKYITHASIIIILWFALSTSTIAFFGLFTKSNKQFEFILTFPLKNYVFPLYIFIKSLITNFILLFFIFLPFVISYASAFNLFNINFFFRFIFVMITIVFITNSIASVLGIFLTFFLKNKGYISGVIGLFVFVFGMIFLINTVLPKEINELYKSNSKDFMRVYNNLPLSKSWLPSYWMNTSLTQSFDITAFYLLFLTISITLGSIFFQKREFINFYSFIFISHTPNKPAYPLYIQKISNYLWKSYPLIYKEILRLFRQPGEAGYAIFILSIDLLFYFFIAKIKDIGFATNSWKQLFILFVFIWIQFVNTAFILRIIFPLMATEGPSAWYIFTLPLTKLKLLFSKILFGILCVIPLIPFNLIIWHIIPLKRFSPYPYSFISLLCLITITIIHVLMGAIFPNFAQGNDPEKTSTSGMGLFTLFISVLIISYAGFFVFGYLNLNIQIQNTLTLLSVLYVFVILTTFWITHNQIKSYEF